MPRINAYPKTNDATLMTVVGTMTRYKAQASNWEAYAALFDAHTDFRLPGPLSECLAVYEKFPVVSNVLRPKRGMLLEKLLLEFEYMLCTDSHLAGAEALWLVLRVDPEKDFHSEASGWLTRMGEDSTYLVARKHEHYGVLAAPMRAFVH